MGRSVTITVPGTPNACLSLNGRAHWRVKAKHAAAFRSTAKYAALNEEGYERLSGKVMVHYVFGWEKGRKTMDFDNLVGLGKAALDGIVDAGVLGDDRHVLGMTAEQTRDPNGVGFLQVTITEAA